MPRQKRILSPTHIYHVMVRGNAGRDIFLDDNDREKIIKIIISKKREENFILYAYCLMNNHFHMVIKEYKDHISHIMRRINTTYALYFNKKYQLTGHLFQNRFRSEVVDSDDYLLALIRYIHYNPVKAGLVDFLKDYQWSSFSHYTDTVYRNQIVHTEDILRLFSEDTAEAMNQFVQFSQGQEERYHFMEYREHHRHKKELITELKTEHFRDEFLKRNNIPLALLSDKKNRAARERLIHEMRDKSIFSDRKIAEILHLARGMVQRVRRKGC